LPVFLPNWLFSLIAVPICVRLSAG